ncbi:MULTISPECIES: hypothetical protein [Aurantimonas]|uniref:hypothetical protein n=1 Tax=Aurantimonas TaxID=182269 RepID=UPI003519B28A
MADSGTDALLVLSYNVCWEAMSHHHGLPLGDACTFVPGNPHLIRCAVNVAHCIDAMPEAMGMDGFAFIGLQEASLVGMARSHTAQPRPGRPGGRLRLRQCRPGGRPDPAQLSAGQAAIGSPAGGRPAAGGLTRRDQGAGFTRPGINGRTA